MKANIQIMKISILTIISISLLTGCATAQTGSFNNLQINNHFRMSGRTINKISNDTTFTNPDSMSLPTAWAVYNYFQNRALTGITTNKPYPVQHISDMLALSATVGDIAIVADSTKSYVLKQVPPSTFSNWLELKSPTISNTDLLSEGASNLYFTNSRALGALIGKNISIFTNDANYTSRQELVDSANNRYKKYQVDSIAALAIHNSGNENIGGGKTIIDSLLVPTRAAADSSPNAASTAWVKARNYIAAVTGIPRRAVPFVDVNGLLNYDPTGLTWDGYNLNVGKSDFYSSTGLMLNGGRASILGSGYGMQLGSGTMDAISYLDNSKKIYFYNNRMPYANWSVTLDSLGWFQSNMTIFPWTNLRYDLGTAAYRWKNVYGSKVYADSLFLNGTPITGGVTDYNLLTNKPTIPTVVSALTNDAGYITSVPAQSWSSITGKPSFSTVATSGSYNDLSSKPTIPTNNNQLTNGSNFITNSALTPYVQKTDSLDSKLLKNQISKTNLPVTNIHTRYPNVAVDDSTVGISQSYLDSLIALINMAKMVNLQNRNYANDSLAVLGGLNLWDYYRNGSAVNVVSKLPNYGSDFNVLFNIKKGGTKQSDTVSVQIKAYSGSYNIAVDWGDGNTNNFTGTYDYTMGHKYASAGTYKAVFAVSDYTKPREMMFKTVTDTINIARINNLRLFTGLTSFTIATPATAQDVIDTLIMPSTLLAYSLQGVNLTSFNPPNLPSGLTTLKISNISTGVFVFSPAVLPATITSLTLTSNYWTSEKVNATLAYLVTKSFNPGTKTLNLRQYQSAIPTGQGIIDEGELESDNWSITTD